MIPSPTLRGGRSLSFDASSLCSPLSFDHHLENDACFNSVVAVRSSWHGHSSTFTTSPEMARRFGMVDSLTPFVLDIFLSVWLRVFYSENVFFGDLSETWS